MDRDDHRRTALESWRQMASGWERRREEIEHVTHEVSEWMVRELAPRPGDTVLELAAGPGDTGFAAATLLLNGRLISSDFSPEMIEVGRRRAAELGLENVEHRVIDAEEIPLEDDSVDGVLCRFGLMLMSDPEAAAAEMRRILRPGRRLALAVWSAAERNPWITIAGRILVELGLVEPPEPGAPGMFVLADEAQLRALLEGAGFTVARLEEIGVLFGFEDIDTYILRSRETGGSFARAWAGATEDQHAEIASRLREGFAPFAVDGGFELPGVALAAAAS